MFEIYKGNLSVEAVICREQEKFCDTMDGFSVVSKGEICKENFDYVIITSSACYDEIKKEAQEIGFEEKQLIDGQKFLLPLFDFERYCQLIENPVTILSDDCWGGVIYHYLGLPFSSPCVNILWEKEEYFKLMQAPLMYLEKELIMVREGDLRNGIWPVGQLGEGSESVKMQFVHSINFDDAKVQWDKRKERINKNNLFIKMGFNGFDDRKDIWLEEFKKVPYKKVCFFNGERGENIFASERFLIRPIRMGRSVEYYSYMDWCRNYSYLGIDILKLLVGDKDYLREGYKENKEQKGRIL